jgi:hypothetical protein
MSEKETRAQISNRELKAFIKNGPPPGDIYVSAAKYFPDFEFRPVETPEEFEEAGHIAYKEYLSSGYIPTNQAKLKLSVYQALPITTTLVAVYKGSYVVGTLSFVEDSALGLPMEGVYHEELNELRKQGRRIVEASALAADQDRISEERFSLSMAGRRLFMFHLMRAMYDAIRTFTKADTMVCCYNPKHDGFYEFFNLLPLGGLKSHAGVQGNPSLARYVYIPDAVAQGNAHMVHNLLLRDLPHLKRPAKKFVPPKDQLMRLLREAGMLKTLHPEALRVIEDSYKEKIQPAEAPSILKIIREAIPMSDWEKDVHRIANSLFQLGARQEDTLVLGSPGGDDFKLILDAARSLHMRVTSLGADLASSRESAEITKPTNLLLVRKLEELDEIPEAWFDAVKAVIVLRRSKDPEKISMYQGLFPSVVSETQLIYWEDEQPSSSRAL